MRIRIGDSLGQRDDVKQLQVRQQLGEPTDLFDGESDGSHTSVMTGNRIVLVPQKTKLFSRRKPGKGLTQALK
jgi:hypothetical protein